MAGGGAARPRRRGGRPHPRPGPAQRAPAATFETNVRGTWNLLEACRTPTVERVVVASSERAGEPAGPYGASKACVELVARSYAAAHGVPVAIARLANVYGPGDLEASRLVPALVGAALGRGPAVVRSGGSPERDLLYAADAAAAFIAVAGTAVAGPPGEAFAVASGTSRSVREVVAALEAVVGAEVPVAYRGVAGEPGDRRRVDASALRERTGWAPRVELAEGLRRTLEWHRTHPPGA